VQRVSRGQGTRRRQNRKTQNPKLKILAKINRYISIRIQK
jgi:hypothetical protein